MTDLKSIFRDVTRALSDNSPAILTAMGAAGVVTTAVLAAKGAIQADRALDEHREGPFGVDRTRYMSRREKFDLTWRYYVPAAVSGTVTVVCIVGSHSINTKRNAAIMGLYTLTDRALTEYQEKTAELFGEGKERSVQDRIAASQVERHPRSQNPTLVTKYGDYLCFDPQTEQYFTGSTEHIRQTVNNLNEHLRTNNTHVTQNKFLQILGRPPVTLGDQIGWTSERLIRVHFSSTLDDDQNPVLVMHYKAGVIRGTSPF